MNNIYVLCGIPGVGKSTWSQVVKKEAKTIIISRDEIRFSLVREDEDYFSKEDDVFNLFIIAIKKAIISNDNINIIIDATHLNPKSRAKLLNRVGRELLAKHNIIAVEFPNDLELALIQNELRKGGRAYVPRGVIRRMSEQFIPPTLEEGFNSIMKVR